MSLNILSIFSILFIFIILVFICIFFCLKYINKKSNKKEINFKKSENINNDYYSL